ncbi:unnamed protein product [Pedinophyceae sp. YPF-701]|nr:unnamed protein product [Pedinophyceae sp. YPF-701]
MWGVVIVLTIQLALYGAQAARVSSDFHTLLSDRRDDASPGNSGVRDWNLRMSPQHYSPELFDAGPVTSLPGWDQPELPSQHYAGYVTVNEEGGRNLFFYLATAEPQAGDNPPLILWLNGGPGCSSFDGFVYEHGPFSFSRASGDASAIQLTSNPFSWTKAGHVVYVDSPAGVGFSYGDPFDLATGDERTSDDMAVMVRMLVDLFGLDEVPVYITGESYAGIYVPTITTKVARGNAQGQLPIVRLEGYAVGNGCTDPVYDGNAYVPFAAGMSLIPQRLYDVAFTACGGGSFWNYTANPNPECQASMAHIHALVSQLNMYDILNKCWRPGPQSHAAALADAIAAHGPTWPLRPVLRNGQRVPSWASLLRDEGLGLNPPCIRTAMADDWLNSEAVRAAIHARPASEIGKWTVCADSIDYTHDMGSMLQYHAELITQHKLRSLIYSGDHDMAVPHTGSEQWTRWMGEQLGVVEPWRAWEVGGQVAGYVARYSGLTYCTVKGAGHMVPQSNPEEALEMIRRFVQDKPL